MNKIGPNPCSSLVNHHIWIRNWVPTRSLKVDKTPLELATSQKPNISGIYPWGCKAWVKTLDVGKLEPRAEECRFVGFDSKSKGYRVYWLEKRRVSIKRDIYFNEKDMLVNVEVHIEGETNIPTNLNHHQPLPTHSSHNKPPTNDKPPENTLDNIKITEKSNNESATSQNQRPARRNSLSGLPQFDNEHFGRGKHRQAPVPHSNTRVVDVEEVIDVDDVSNPKRKMFVDQGGDEINDSQLLESALAMSEDEPSLREALNGNECTAWTDAIKAELAQMEKVNAWTPVIPPSDVNIVPCCYVFHRKQNETGLIVHYKARLVVKCFKQQFGIDYTDTFTPTIHSSTLHILLSFATQKGAAIHQCDVKNAYLNSRLKDNVTLYSELPPKYKAFREVPPDLKDKPRVVCKWHVSVYGSKQGTHDWYCEVKNFFTDIGYSISTADKAIFYKIKEEKFTIVAAATDNFSVFADSSETANLLIQKQLGERFKISDLGPINWLLGVSITRDLSAHTISLGQ